MFKRIIIVILISFLFIGVFSPTSNVFAQAPTNTNTDSSSSNSSGGVIGFTQCNFSTTSESASISPCIQQILTFLFVIGIFLMAFRIAYIGINRFNPLDGNSEGEQIGLIRDIIIGLVLLGAPALILSAFNQNLLTLDFLNFTGFTGGPAESSRTESNTNLQNVTNSGATIVSQSTLLPPVPATVNANISGGRVISVAITNPGSGYTSPPTVTFSGGGGNGAVGVANVLGGKITNIAITNPGSGYTSPPTVTLSGGIGGGSVGSGINSTFTDPSTSDFVQGITPLLFSANYEGYKVTGSDVSGAITKVLAAQEACRSVFAQPQFSKADCDTLKKGNFDSTLNQIPQSVKQTLLASSGLLGYGSEFFGLGALESQFTNLVDIEVSPSGIPSKTIPTFNSLGQVDRSKTCIENYIKIEAVDYPTRVISTQDCTDQLSDTSGITKFESIFNSEDFGDFGFQFITGNAFNRTVVPNTIRIPAGTQFNRKIKYIS